MYLRFVEPNGAVKGPRARSQSAATDDEDDTDDTSVVSTLVIGLGGLLRFGVRRGLFPINVNERY
jgi:hypothetical protein